MALKLQDLAAKAREYKAQQAAQAEAGRMGLMPSLSLMNGTPNPMLATLAEKYKGQLLGDSINNIITPVTLPEKISDTPGYSSKYSLDKSGNVEITKTQVTPEEKARANYWNNAAGAKSKGSTSDRRYQSALSLENYYVKIRDRNDLDQNLREQAGALAQDINAQRTQFLNGDISDFNITPMKIEDTPEEKNLIQNALGLKPGTKKSFVPATPGKGLTPDKVLVINPQGQRGYIPVGQLSVAIKQGYKEVR